MLRLLRLMVLALMSAAFLYAAPASRDADASAWWAAATKAYGLSSGFTASRTVIRIEELDNSGAVKSYESGETRVDWSGKEPRVVVVKAEKNGKDTTDEWRKRYAKSSAGKPGGDASSEGPPAGFDATPFDPKYSAVLSRGAALPATGMVQVPYVITTDGGPVDGTARFSESGQVLGATQVWLKPPIFVSSMRSSLTYAYHDGALVMASMQIEGEASILFVKKRFRMALEFSDWKKTPG
jgi:hypothetical protein